MILTVFLVVVAIVFKSTLCPFYDVKFTHYPDGERFALRETPER